MSDKTSKDWKKVREEIDAQEPEASMDWSDEEEGAQSAEEVDVEPALGHPSYEDLEQQLTLAEQKAHQNWEKCIRAQAELDNVRRRAEKDVANAHRYGLEKFIDSLLPVIDSLEQALQIARQNQDEAMVEGLDLTMKLFVETLNKHHVEQINPEGEPFDPQVHEAMSMQPSDEVPSNHVLAVFQKGYKLNERVVRPARVIVAKGN